MSSHARHNDARRYQEVFGGSHAQALRQVREQRPPARGAFRALTSSTGDGKVVRRCSWSLKSTWPAGPSSTSTS